MTFTYTSGIPATSNNPSTDQPNMQVNNDSNASIWSIDHYGFNNASGYGGKHNYIRFPINSAPASTGATEILIYNGSSVIGGSYNLWFAPNNVTVGLSTSTQLTRNEVPVSGTNGYSWLPGGILIQWGTIAIAAAGSYTAVSFSSPNINFTTCYNVILTMINNQGTAPSANSVFVKSGSVSNTGFEIVNTSSSSTQSAYWMAIGK